MNNKRFLFLFATWLIMPPVFFFVAKKRGIEQAWRRLLLSLFSPFSLVLYIALYLLYMAHFDPKLETWRLRRELKKEQNIESNILHK